MAFGGRGPEEESVRVAPDDAERGIAGAQTANKIVAGAGTGAGDENAPRDSSLGVASERGRSNLAI